MRERLQTLGSSLTAGRTRRRLLFGWTALGVAEVVLASSDVAAFAWHQSLLEVLGLALVGVVHGRLAKEGWLASAAWPGAVYGVLVVGRRIYWSMALSFAPLMPLVLAAVLGVVVLAAFGVWLFDRLLWQRLPAAPMAAMAPLLLRLVVVGPPQTLQTFLPSPDPTATGPAIVVVTVDTLRADHAVTMEAWRWLEQRGATWPRAMAASSWTWPSLVTLWSGVAAEDHGAGRQQTVHRALREWSEAVPWLPRELAAAGYVSAAFTTNPIVQLMPIGETFSRVRHGDVIGMPMALVGFARDDVDGGNGAEVVDAALAWLDDVPPAGFLLWVHLYEPHLPYRQAEGGYDFNLMRNARSGDWFIDQGEQRRIRDAYAQQVAWVDRQVVRLFEGLEARGVLRHGALMFSADHGEELFDHGGFEHGHSHHGEVIDVPLALVAPGVAPGERPGLASHEDVAPTLRAIAGLPAAGTGLDLRQELPPDRLTRAAGNLYYGPAKSVRSAGVRVIIEGETARRYDLNADPKELAPSPLEPAERAALEAAAPKGRLPQGAEVDLEKKALEALGYVH